MSWLEMTQGFLIGQRMKGQMTASGKTSAGNGGVMARDMKIGVAFGLASKGAPYRSVGEFFGAEYYAQYFVLPEGTISAYSNLPVNEYGMMIIFNEGATVKRCGFCVYQGSNNYWIRIPAIKGSMKWAVAVPYLANNGVVVVSADDNDLIHSFVLTNDADGVWSYNGNYSGIVANLTNAKGNELAALNNGMSNSKAQLFKTVDSLKSYMTS